MAVIASEAKQPSGPSTKVDCFVAALLAITLLDESSPSDLY
jgi:hypothetical protein